MSRSSLHAYNRGRHRHAYVWVREDRLVSLSPPEDIPDGLRNLYRAGLNGFRIGDVERAWESRKWVACRGEVRREFRTRQDAVEFLVRESGR